MKFLFRFALMLFALVFFARPILADDKPADAAAKEAAKAEADYQHWIKDHVGYKLLTVEYDKFKKDTVISDDPRMSNELEFKKPDGGGLNMNLMVSAHVPDSEEGFVNLIITAEGSSEGSWRYLDCHDFNWLVDGADLAVDNEDYDNHVYDDASTSEYISLSLNMKAFAKLVKAGKIECKICNDEFNFQRNQMWVLRWVYEQIQALKAPAAK